MGPPVKLLLVVSTILALGSFGCSAESATVSAAINRSSSFVAELPANPLQWRVITSSINEQDATMSTLYGNDAAVDYIRKHAEHDYPVGAVLSLVTWTQREDPRWFGGRIPDLVKSVEFVVVQSGANGRPDYSYVAYQGASLTNVSAHDDAVPNERAAYILSQRAAVLP